VPLVLQLEVLQKLEQCNNLIIYMSSRRNLNRYASGDYTPPTTNVDKPGLLSALTGQDKLSGGQLTTTPQGETSFVPYKGSSGLFGGWSRRQAAQLNVPFLMSQLEASQEKSIEAQKAKQLKEQSIQDSVNKLAASLGVTPDQITGGLKDKLYAGADERQKQILDNMNTPEFHKSLAMGQNALATGLPPTTLFPSASQGGIATGPSLPGLTNNPNIARGATPLPQNVVTDQFGIMHLIGGGAKPGSFGSPVTQDEIDRVQQDNAGDSETNRPSFNDIMNPRGTNDLSTIPQGNIPMAPPGMNFNVGAPGQPMANPINDLTTTPPNPAGVPNSPFDNSDAQSRDIQMLLEALKGLRFTPPTVDNPYGQ